MAQYLVAQGETQAVAYGGDLSLRLISSVCAAWVVLVLPGPRGSCGRFVYCKRQQGETLCDEAIDHGAAIGRRRRRRNRDTRIEPGACRVKKESIVAWRDRGQAIRRKEINQKLAQQRKLKLQARRREKRPSKRYSRAGQGQRRNKSVSWAMVRLDATASATSGG